MSVSNKVVIGSLSGLIVGLLVMKGVIAPGDASATTQELDTLAGALLTIISVIGFFEHHSKQVDQPPASKSDTSDVPPQE